MELEIKPLERGDLPEADKIMRLAFGTFLGLPDPLSFLGDADLVYTRWRAAPEASFGAYAEGKLIGSNFAARRGSFGFFGPLTVRPDHWDRGVAQALLATTMQIFDQWGTADVGLFTFPQSIKHVGLYQKFGFWPQALTAVMAKPVGRDGSTEAATLSSLAGGQQAGLAALRRITDSVHPGLDASAEILAVSEQSLGDTVLLYDGTDLAGFAVCHVGPRTEAGSDTLYVKFGAVRADAGREPFDRLLDACEAFARTRGVKQIVAGVNMARHEAYRVLLDRGFRSVLHGVAMQRGNKPGYNRPECFVLDDCR